MRLHSNAATTPAVRRRIQEATGSLREIARRFGVSTTTVVRWRGRESVEDRSSRPHLLACAFDEESERKPLELRLQGLALDEVFEALMDERPRLCRTSLWRLFRRHGLARLKRAERERAKTFKIYLPGYVHIDSFCTPRFGKGRYYGFVAVDRATRRTHVAMYSDKSQASGADFLKQCLQPFEFKIHKILTDNGSEFTNKTYKNGKAKNMHAFEKICREEGIEHRRTRPRTPKTNGLAERQVAIVKNATSRIHTYVGPQALEKDLLDWNERNNRRRQRRIRYKSPIQLTREWYQSDKSLFKRRPDANEAAA